MDKISVITICYNEEKKIEETILSVLKQSYSNYEYIIKDGGSSDSTNEIIEKYREIFEEKGCRFVHLQGKDSGIYDAMNIALEKCTGTWVNYMNAGDSFYNENVLDDIFRYGKYSDADIIYGHTCCVLRNGYSFIIKNHHLNLTKGIGISQQVCFYKKSILEQRGFETKYKILGDFEYLIYALNNEMRFGPINNIVARYNREGISSTNTYTSFIEKNEVLNLSYSRKDIMREKIKMMFTKFFPHVSDMLFCIHTSKLM